MLMITSSPAPERPGGHESITINSVGVMMERREAHA